MTAEPLLLVARLAKRYGAYWAVRDVSFALPPGRALVVVGPNAAGKSTLLRLLAGVLRPTEGHVDLGGERVGGPGESWRRRVGLLGHQVQLYPALTARENLLFFARLYGLPDPRTRVDALLERLELTPRADDRVRTFSRGLQQRLALARVLLHDPELLLLDEPFTALDAPSARRLRTLLGELKREGRSLVVVTHRPDEVLDLADAVALQIGGRWAWQGPPAELDTRNLAALFAAPREGRWCAS